MKQTEVQKFRDTATEDNWKKLVDDAEKTTPVGDDIKKIYGFAWSSIRQDAIDKGYYKPRRKSKTIDDSNNSKKQTFVIDDLDENIKIISKSVQFYDSVLERLQNLENSKKQYTKRAILNQLLSEALNKYGF